MSEDDKQHRKNALAASDERIPADRDFEFLATMAHELRNPMTPLLGQVHLLRTIVRHEVPPPENLLRTLERLEAAVEVFMRRATTVFEALTEGSGQSASLVRNVAEGQ